MNDITNSGTPNFSLPTATPKTAVASGANISDEPYGVHSEQDKIRDTAQFNAPKVGSTGVSGAPVVSAPSLDGFSPELDINQITNSGTPGSTTAIGAPGSSSLHGEGPTVSPIGPPAEDQSAASEHVDGLTRGIAGVVLTAPLVGLEKLGQTSFAETARSYIPTGAGGTNTSSTAQQLNAAGSTVAEQAPILANQAAEGAATLASQAAMLAQQAYASAQANFQATQPNPADSLHELAEGVDRSSISGGEQHSTAIAPKPTTAVTAVEPSPILPIDGAVLLPSSGAVDPTVDGVDQATVDGSQSVEGPAGEIPAHLEGLPESAPTFLAALPSKDLPDEATAEAGNKSSATPALVAAGAGAVGAGALYEISHNAQNDKAATDATAEDAASVPRTESPQFGAASVPKSAEHPVIPVPEEGSSLLKGGNEGTAIPKADVAPIKDDTSAAASSGQTPIEKTPVAPITAGDQNQKITPTDKVADPGARGDKSAQDDKIAAAASAAKGGNKGETRSEPIDTSPPTDHDNAVPMFLEGGEKEGLGSKIKSLFHKS